ncbi:hypothetical protein [Vitiosangium sp. GDMCC 1.1324]|uniref:hypothetical protein n=1 Tax=Vitiosangium sp. (strain GDMCC 1.1324) TaxID=2138576 RepID=UPI000D37BE77|nr:hypothetical protein [Vitiosangium sp. GDMCC 1.1324]PTL81188.1 hypothetical protein DAT35_23985 [Vitiosangium sp. GDMCC 1.1324]
MPFTIRKVENCPAGLFAPTTPVPAPNDAAGNAIASWSYHHIIPKEKLKSFFDKVMVNGDGATKEFKQICTFVIQKHYRYRHGDTYPSALAFQDNNAPAQAANEAGVTMAVIAVLTGMHVDADTADGATTGRWGLFENFWFWWPANLHRGPGSALRLQPAGGGANWDENLDDGGDRFEKSAKHVLPKKQFEDLSALQAAMDVYEGKQSTSAYAAARLTALKEVLKRMRVLVPSNGTYTKPVEFDPSRWVRVMISGANRYRVVPR